MPVTHVTYDCTDIYPSYLRLYNYLSSQSARLPQVTTTVQKLIVVVSADTAVATTVQIFIVVVSAGTAVPTTVQIFIVVVTSRVRQYTNDSTETYREDDEDDEDDDDEEGAKKCFKLAKNLVYSS